MSSVAGEAEPGRDRTPSKHTLVHSLSYGKRLLEMHRLHCLSSVMKCRAGTKTGKNDSCAYCPWEYLREEVQVKLSRTWVLSV